MDETTRKDIQRIAALTLRDAGLTEPPLSVEGLLEHVKLQQRLESTRAPISQIGRGYGVPVQETVPRSVQVVVNRFGKCGLEGVLTVPDSVPRRAHFTTSPRHCLQRTLNDALVDLLPAAGMEQTLEGANPQADSGARVVDSEAMSQPVPSSGSAGRTAGLRAPGTS